MTIQIPNVPDIEKAIFEILSKDDGVISLVGTSAGTRIFQEKLAQGTAYPAITYQLISDPAENSHSGSSHLAQARVQIDCWAETKEETMAVAAAVKQAIISTHRVVANVFIQSAMKDNEQTIFDAEIRKRRRILEFLIYHSEVS